MAALVGYVSDDYRHIVSARGKALMLITEYRREGHSALIRAVDEEGQHWSGVASHQPFAKVTLHRALD